MSNFHETAEVSSIRIDEGRFLRCLLRRENGELEEAELDLNCCIGNIDGKTGISPSRSRFPGC